MLRIENDSEIHINRGDTGIIDFIIPLCGNTRYMFNTDDKITFDVYEKRGFDKCSLLHKEVIVEAPIDVISFELTSKDTTIGELINKPMEYWYEIQYTNSKNNTNETVLGYDQEGAKKFVLYPEGSDKVCQELEEVD